MEVLPNVIRTIIPVAAGLLVGWAAKVGLNISADLALIIVTIVATAVYQSTARWLEVHVSPVWGRILLAAGLTQKTPTYK